MARRGFAEAGAFSPRTKDSWGDRYAVCFDANVMNTQTVAVLVSLVIGATSSVGCAAHYATVDGYDAAYVEYAPPYIEAYPRYRFHDGYVYDVHGRYYHEHGRRWVEYREMPHELREGRANRQRR